MRRRCDQPITRTAVSLKDELVSKVRREAVRRGPGVSRFIADTLDDALKRRELKEPPFRLVTVSGEGPAPGADLDRPHTLDVTGDEIGLRRLS